MDRISSEHKEPGKEYTAFFDLDLTLTGAISGNALVRTAWKKGLISWRELITGFLFYLLYRLRLRDPLRIIGDMVSWVRGKTETELKELCASVFNEVLLPSLFIDAIKEISFHKDRNARVIILSSALDYLCRAISENLGIDGYICSSLEASGGFLTGRPAGRLCFGEEKLNRLNGYCITRNIDKSTSWFYSDSISDLPVLNSVGNPVCVNPDRRLNREATKRGWKILHWEN